MIQLQAKYRIGAVANLTGVSTHTIRAWERRYDLTLGTRTEGGTRLYSDDDIVRLSLLKSLIKKGEAISAIAGLSTQELKERLAKHAQSQQEFVGNSAAAQPFTFLPDPVATVVLGKPLIQCVNDSFAASYNLDVSWQVEDSDTLLNRKGDRLFKLLLAHVSDVVGCPLAFIQAWQKVNPNCIVVLVYEFLAKKELKELMAAGVKLIRWPVEPEFFGHFIAEKLMLEKLRPFLISKPESELRDQIRVPEALFTVERLQSLRNADANISCECSRHLSTLITDLSAFEAYSQKCGANGDEEAQLHQQLHLQTAMARFMMEQLLNNVLQYEKSDAS